MCYGWLVLKNGALVAKGYGACARSQAAGSFSAEYLALIEGLDALLDMGVCDQQVQIIGDAKGVIDQMRGTAVVNVDHILPLYGRAWMLAQELQQVEWVWRARKHNRVADTLSRRALRNVWLDQTRYQQAVQALQRPKRLQPYSERFIPLLDLRIYKKPGPPEFTPRNRLSSVATASGI
jgi:ribonuclease HI